MGRNPLRPSPTPSMPPTLDGVGGVSEKSRPFHPIPCHLSRLPSYRSFCALGQAGGGGHGGCRRGRPPPPGSPVVPGLLGLVPGSRDGRRLRPQPVPGLRGPVLGPPGKDPALPSMPGPPPAAEAASTQRGFGGHRPAGPDGGTGTLQRRTRAQHCAWFGPDRGNGGGGVLGNVCEQERYSEMGMMDGSWAGRVGGGRRTGERGGHGRVALTFLGGWPSPTLRFPDAFSWAHHSKLPLLTLMVIVVQRGRRG